MSWGTTRKGKREEVGKLLVEDFDRFSAMYAPGTLEGDDVIAARVRVSTLLAALDLSPDSYYDSDLVVVEAHGSHSWSGDVAHPRAANFSVAVGRVRAVT
jgi:hypothetical protein